LEAVRDTQGYQKLPPELRSGMTLDSRADVYSLAMLTVEMLTGGTDRTAVGGPDTLKTVLARALADDPMVRHTSVDALAHELDAALSGQAPRPRRPTPPVGVPIAKERVEDAPPKPDDVRPPSMDTTRSIDPEELELLKGDQVTRQVPLDELLPLRAASSETQQVPLQDLIVEDDNYDELTLEQPTLEQPAKPIVPPPPSTDSGEHDIRTDQVFRLEPDAAKTTEHPRLPPPIVEDEIDTQRVTRADVHDMVAPPESPEEREEPHDPNATPLPPPMPQSSILTPRAMQTPLEALADAKDLPTKVDKGSGAGEPKGGSGVELPPPAPAMAPPPKDKPLYDGDEAPTRTVFPDGVSSAPDASPPAPPPASSPSSPSSPPSPPTPSTSHVPMPMPSNVPTPIAPAPSARKRRNPFEPVPPPDDALTTEHRSPPPRPRKNPFDAPPPPDKRDAGAGTVDVRSRREKKKPRSTILVSPLGGAPKTSAAPVLLVAIAAFIAAVGVALAISHYLTEQRLADERREKQRLADQLNQQAEAMRQKQALHPDAGAATTVPVVTRADPMATLLPRQGACPLGAHLVTSGGHSFCIDVYEYPGGNTIPRTNVSFGDATRICTARGERLCTEGEWERACRGKGGASYPYGQAFDPARCNTKGAGAELSPTGAFQSCKSAVGAYDMSGNVAEWVASGAQKGGNAREGAKESRCSAVTRGAPVSGGPLVGFRCCADPGAKH
ncbi:MAG TPA: SUMF1/EgtB/PvdO family nonheme iron enzyme, partial [Polyangia bacterium]